MAVGGAYNPKINRGLYCNTTRLALGMEHFPRVVPESAVVAGSMNKPTKETVAIEEDISKFRNNASGC